MQLLGSTKVDNLLVQMCMAAHSHASLQTMALAAFANSERREQTVAAQVPVHCGEHCIAFSSYTSGVAASPPASRLAELGSPNAILELRARFSKLQQVLGFADSLGSGFAGALSSKALGVEVEGAFRAALVGDAPGLGEVTLEEEVEVQHAVLGEGGQHARRKLAVRLSASLSTGELRHGSP